MTSEAAADDVPILQVNELVPDVSRVVGLVPGAGPAIDDVVGRVNEVTAQVTAPSVSQAVGEAGAFAQSPAMPALPPLPLPALPPLPPLPGLPPVPMPPEPAPGQPGLPVLSSPAPATGVTPVPGSMFVPAPDAAAAVAGTVGATGTGAGDVDSTNARIAHPRDRRSR